MVNVVDVPMLTARWSRITRRAERLVFEGYTGERIAVQQ
jgi:hypothetical protein